MPPRFEEISYELSRTALADEASLTTVSLLHQEQLLHNRKAVDRLTRLSAVLAVVTIVQSLLWIVAIGVR